MATISPKGKARSTPTTPVAPAPLGGEQRVVLRGITWEGFQAICDQIGDQPAVRVAYSDGDLELMSPLYDHEIFTRAFEFLIPEVASAFGLPCRNAGSTLFRSEEAARGKEADDYFYLTRAPLVEGRAIDPQVDPAPDLAIEIEITRSIVPSLPIYAALGVTEVWRVRGTTLQFLHLQDDGTYAERPASALLPMIRPDEIADWLDLARTSDTGVWRAQVRDWIRDVLLARRREDQP